MVERVLLVLKVKNLTASKFADEIGVQRSSISHILSGRNLPSLDLIQKVLKTYPEINSDWLLNGIGPMTKSSNIDLFNSVTEEKTETAAVQPDLFGTQISENQEQSAEKELIGNERIMAIPQSDFDKNASIGIGEEIFNSDEVKVTNKLHENGAVVSEIKNERPKPKKPDIQNEISSDKKIEKIVIFYNNKTFREYFPE